MLFIKGMYTLQYAYYV